MNSTPGNSISDLLHALIYSCFMFSYPPLLEYNSSTFRDAAGQAEGRVVRSGHAQGQRRCQAVNQPGTAQRPRKQATGAGPPNGITAGSTSVGTVHACVRVLDTTRSQINPRRKRGRRNNDLSSVFISPFLLFTLQPYPPISSPPPSSPHSPSLSLLCICPLFSISPRSCLRR